MKSGSARSKRTVESCLKAKIATGEIVHIDSSLIRANVSWIPATVLLGGGRPVATYIGVRALPCRSTVGFCD